MRIIGYISLAFGALAGLMFVIYLFQRTKKKSLKNRRKIKARRRFYGLVTALFLVAGAALIFADGRASYTPKDFISALSPVENYQNSSSYEALPDGIFALGDDFYVKNGKGQVFGHLEITGVTKDEQGNEVSTTSYERGLCLRGVSQVTGEGDFLAARSTGGTLRLYGAFEYLTYERNDTVFRGAVYGRSCTYADGTANNLLFVDKGKLYSVGYNAFGQLGDGTERNRLEKAAILSDVASVSVSETHVLAVDVYGDLYGFGDNTYSEMGNRTTAQNTTPIKLMSGVKQAVAGRYFSVVLAKNGDVYVAGRNHLGQLGTGDGREYANYRKILEGVTKIAVGGNSCAALTAGGALYVWGDNAQHQLGLGGETVTEPTVVANDVYDVAMGESSMGILRLNRDVYVTGTARLTSDNQYLQCIWQFDAQVPDEYLYREVVSMPERPVQ